MTKKAVKIPRKIFEDLENLQSSGTVDMFNHAAVINEAFGFQYYEAVVWIQSNYLLYFQGIAQGFEPID